jgi:hypothetical protein
MVELTLKQSLEIAKRIKERDYNDEIEVYVDNMSGTPHLFIVEKLITIGGITEWKQ